MPSKLVDMEIDRVSTVDRGANGRSFAILKRAGAGPWSEIGPLQQEPGLVERLAKAIAGAIGIEKATKTEDGKDFPASDFAYVPDPDKPSTWKLRLTAAPGAEPDARIVGAAIAALGKGFRGQKVEIPAGDLAGVKAKVRAAWTKANPDKEQDEMPDVIAKAAQAQTFANLLAGQAVNSAIEENWWTLKDALWGAFYARDENDQPVSMDERKALVAQNLDEFKAYLLSEMDTGVGKREEGSSDSLAIAGLVAKVGKKISAARLTRLKEAADALRAVLAEVESEEDMDKRARAQEGDDMTSEELAKALGEALTPVIQRLEAVEKRLPAEEPGEAEDGKKEVAKADDEAPEWAVSMLDRIEKLEAGRGQRTSANGEDATVEKKGSDWTHGIL